MWWSLTPGSSALPVNWIDSPEVPAYGPFARATGATLAMLTWTVSVAWAPALSVTVSVATNNPSSAKT